jgi:TIR domain-containing protein
VPEIFINYRSSDCKDAAVAIEQNLSARFGSDQVFRAAKSIRPGENYRTGLATASSGVRVLLALIGPNWLDARDRNGDRALDNEDDWTRKGILNAMESGARVIPILCGRKMDRLSVADLPPDLAPLADLQSLTYDTGSADADMARIAAELVDLVPGLVDRTAQAAPEGGGPTNSNSGQAGTVVQGRDMTNGPITTTTFNGPTGPVSTGSGNQNLFYGNGTSYVEGNVSGGIRQTVGKKQERNERR